MINMNKKIINKNNGKRGLAVLSIGTLIAITAMPSQKISASTVKSGHILSSTIATGTTVAVGGTVPGEGKTNGSVNQGLNCHAYAFTSVYFVDVNGRQSVETSDCETKVKIIASSGNYVQQSTGVQTSDAIYNSKVEVALPDSEDAVRAESSHISYTASGGVKKSKSLSMSYVPGNYYNLANQKTVTEYK